MTFLRFLVPALAVAGLAAAQSSDSCKGPKTIQNQGDATSLSELCTTIDGDLIIAPQTANVLKLDGLQHIKGKLSCVGATNLTSLSSDQIQTIDDVFQLQGLTSLNELQFDGLETVGEIDFEAVPQLQDLSFKLGVSKASKVRITNTGLTSLDGIDLKTVGDMDISNNRFLKDVNVNDISNITGLVSFAANHQDLKISFPSLSTAKNMTFRNASAVSLPSLKSTDGLLGFYSNYFDSFVAPNLTTTGGLVFADNSALTNISCPVLQTVKGPLQIANNTALKTIDGFPQLKTIYGALDFSGNFTTVNLPALNEVRGGFNMQSSGNLNCASFNGLKANVQGTFTCLSGVSNPQTQGGTPTSGGSKPTKSGAAGALDPPATMSLMAILGLVLRLLF